MFQKFTKLLNEFFSYTEKMTDMNIQAEEDSMWKHLVMHKTPFTDINPHMTAESVFTNIKILYWIIELNT